MTIPDWTQAPAEATHYDCNADVFCTVDGWFYDGTFYCEKNVGWHGNRYTPRPVEPAGTEWILTGRPPVGKKCEAVWLEMPDGGDRDFHRVMIKGYWKDKVWFSSESGEDFTHLVAYVDFRPISNRAKIDRSQLVTALNQLRNEADVGVVADVILSIGFRLER